MSEHYKLEYDTHSLQLHFACSGFAEDAPGLCEDLKRFALKVAAERGVAASREDIYRRYAIVHVQMHLPDDYPHDPPLVRVVTPRLRPCSGPLAAEGAICAEILATSGWKPIGTTNLILIVRSFLVRCNARIDFASPRVLVPYEFDEAVSAFNRAAKEHGWTPIRPVAPCDASSREEVPQSAALRP